MNQDLQLIEKIENDSKWLQSHYDEIQEKYENEYIAIENGDVIANGNKISEIIKKLKQKGKNPALILVEFVPKKGVKIIL